MSDLRDAERSEGEILAALPTPPVSEMPGLPKPSHVRINGEIVEDPDDVPAEAVDHLIPCRGAAAPRREMWLLGHGWYS